MCPFSKFTPCFVTKGTNHTNTFGCLKKMLQITAYLILKGYSLIPQRPEVYRCVACFTFEELESVSLDDIPRTCPRELYLTYEDSKGRDRMYSLYRKSTNRDENFKSEIESILVANGFPVMEEKESLPGYYVCGVEPTCGKGGDAYEVADAMFHSSFYHLQTPKPLIHVKYDPKDDKVLLMYTDKIINDKYTILGGILNRAPLRAVCLTEGKVMSVTVIARTSDQWDEFCRGLREQLVAMNVRIFNAEMERLGAHKYKVIVTTIG